MGLIVRGGFKNLSNIRVRSLGTVYERMFAAPQITLSTNNIDTSISDDVVSYTDVDVSTLSNTLYDSTQITI